MSSLVPTPSRAYTRTWLQDTVPVSVRSTFVRLLYPSEDADRRRIDVFRSSGSWRLRKLKMSAARTSSNCLPQASVSLSLTVCRRVVAPSSPTGRAPLTSFHSFGGVNYRKSTLVPTSLCCCIHTQWNFASPSSLLAFLHDRGFDNSEAIRSTNPKQKRHTGFDIGSLG